MAATAKWLFVARLRWTVDSAALAQYFSKFGRVQRATVQIDEKTGRSKGYGFVTMAEKEAVSDILSRGAHSIEGKRVDVSVFKRGMRGVQEGSESSRQAKVQEDIDIEDMS